MVGESRGDKHTVVITYVAVSMTLFAVFLALTQRYVASLISLASAVIILSFISERRCRD